MPIASSPVSETAVSAAKVAPGGGPAPSNKQTGSLAMMGVGT